MFVQGVSANGSVLNPYDTEEGRAAGAHIFAQRCAICHGINGIGGIGPSLDHPGRKYGDSDLAIYKVLKSGIPGTPMVPSPLSFPERWQVIAYLTNLMIHGAGTDTDEKAHLNINVSSEQIRSAGTKSDESLTYSGSLDGHRYTPL